jgi:hypothetical protein
MSYGDLLNGKEFKRKNPYGSNENIKWDKDPWSNYVPGRAIERVEYAYRRKRNKPSLDAFSDAFDMNEEERLERIFQRMINKAVYTGFVKGKYKRKPYFSPDRRFDDELNEWF